MKGQEIVFMSKINGIYNKQLFLDLNTMFSSRNMKLIKTIQIGGDPQKYKIDKHHYFVNITDYVANEEPDKIIHVYLISFKNEKARCGTIIFEDNSDTAIIHEVLSNIECIARTGNKIIKKPGEILIKIMIQIIKDKGYKKIELSDNSYYSCGDGHSISLLKGRTLTHGFPYYVKFGFMPIDNVHIKYMTDNYEFMSTVKVKDIGLKNIIRKKLKELNLYEKHKIEYETIKKLIYLHNDDSLMVLLKIIMDKFCWLFYYIYNKIYQKLKLNEYDSKIFTLHIT